MAVLVLSPAAASAHPLGNFSVNQLTALTFTPSRVGAAVTVDFAELPTLQQPSLDAATECAAFNAAFAVRIAGGPLRFTVDASSVSYSDGAAGLRTSRLECTLSAPADLSRSAVAEVTSRYRDDRVGWRELTAVAEGVHLVSSPLPTASRTDGLRTYPEDLLSSPPDVRSARLAVEPGGSTVASSPPPGPSPLPSWLSAAEERLRGWAASRELTPFAGILAVLLALLLGGAHAALPGHGKTVMAAYLAGRRGRPRDALAVGATVTLTHTGGVLALGLLLTSVAGLAGETVLGWLGVVSGLLVALIGATMLRRRTHPHSHSHDHHHAGHAHPAGPSRWSIIGMGVAGGLVPSPSALVVLLGAIALGRTWFGVLLVLSYGAGMAAVLTAAGLVLIRVRDSWPTRLRPGPRLARFAPTGTAALVLLVGSALAVRSFAAL
ncbi:nickel/cobalt transporter [Dactylosporangium sp. CA-233914]|uniref:nickel/cobalt transporter n=1 Tax=Dactylosporangium sp. CA-233914 TaxID=3239934 RepID=UPI003D8BE523